MTSKVRFYEMHNKPDALFAFRVDMIFLTVCPVNFEDLLAYCK